MDRNVVAICQFLDNYAAGEKKNRFDLRVTYLYRATLKSVKLKFANLTEVELSCAHLEGANFCCATLECTQLAFANLIDADLWGANLEGLILSE